MKFFRVAIDQDVKNAHNLKRYKNGVNIKNVYLNNIDDDPVPGDPANEDEPIDAEDYFHYDNLMFGKELLGIILPDGVESVDGVFDWYTIHNNNYETGYVLNIRTVENKIRNDIAFALYDRFGVEPERPLVPAVAPDSIEKVDSWHSNTRFYNWQQPYVDNSTLCTFLHWDVENEVYTPLRIPPMPANLKFYGSAYKDLFRRNILGSRHIQLFCHLWV